MLGPSSISGYGAYHIPDTTPETAPIHGPSVLTSQVSHSAVPKYYCDDYLNDESNDKTDRCNEFAMHHVPENTPAVSHNDGKNNVNELSCTSHSH